MPSKDVIVGNGGSCDYCGGHEDVVQYRRDDDETYRVCDPCEQAAAAARGVE